MHSGDIGRFDERGHLHVIGRLNDTFKTSKGTFVVPAPLARTIATWPAVDQVLVTGSGLSQPIARLCGPRSQIRLFGADPASWKLVVGLCGSCTGAAETKSFHKRDRTAFHVGCYGVA
ncbi:MAG TPA: hypothetical protein VMF89_22205 [Polyangiales bacterium]|nr:hypothetical protein [Polyangiales bacterium]